MIELKNITKSYIDNKKKVSALDKASCQLKGQDNVIIAGPRKSGKTTLLKLIGNTLFPDSGEIFNSYNVSWPIMHVKMQTSMSLAQNIRFLARLANHPRPFKLVNHVKAKLASDIDLNAIVAKTSREKQLEVAFATGLSLPFTAILFEGIPRFSSDAMNEHYMAQLYEKSKTCKLIIESHNLGPVKDLCECVALVNQGKIVTYYNYEEATQALKEANAALET